MRQNATVVFDLVSLKDPLLWHVECEHVAKRAAQDRRSTPTFLGRLLANAIAIAMTEPRSTLTLMMPLPKVDRPPHCQAS